MSLHKFNQRHHLLSVKDRSIADNTREAHGVWFLHLSGFSLDSGGTGSIANTRLSDSGAVIPVTKGLTVCCNQKRKPMMRTNTFIEVPVLPS